MSDNSFIWQFIAADPGNTEIHLTASIDPAAYHACRGDYCEGAARTIISQIAAGNSLFNPYALLTTSNVFKKAASLATPELINENIQVIQLITRSVMDIAPMWNTLHGKSAGDAKLFQPGEIWLKPYGASMIQDESNTVEGFNATAYGVAIGKDIQITDGLVGGGSRCW